VNGKLSSWQSYVAAGVGGAIGAEAALYTGGVAAGAVGGAAYSLTNQYLNSGSLNAGTFVSDTVVAAATAGIGSKVLPVVASALPNSVKGAIGETASIAYNAAQGSKLTGTQVKVNGLSSVIDSSWESISGQAYFVESKFGNSTLTSAQRT